MTSRYHSVISYNILAMIGDVIAGLSPELHLNLAIWRRISRGSRDARDGISRRSRDVRDVIAKIHIAEFHGSMVYISQRH
jgi:hypothetical protein